MKIVAIVGSSKVIKPSINHAVLETAKELIPPESEIIVADVKKLPMYSEDYDENYPSEALEFKQLVKSADALLFVTPEYNRSVPPLLSNAIAWASRPWESGQWLNAWDSKPAAIMGAANGTISTFGAQNHLRQMLSFVNVFPINKPGVMISGASDKIKNGRVIDKETRRQIKDQLEALITFAKQLKK